MAKKQQAEQPAAELDPNVFTEEAAGELNNQENGTQAEDATIAEDSVSAKSKDSSPETSTVETVEENEAPALGKDSENSGSNSQASREFANIAIDHISLDACNSASVPEPSKDSALDGKTDEAPALGESSASVESAFVPAADSVDLHAETVVSAETTEAPLETPSACLLLPLDKLDSLANVRLMLETPEYKKAPGQFEHLQKAIAEFTAMLNFDEDNIDSFSDDLIDRLEELFPKEPPMNRSQMADRLVFAILTAHLKKRELEQKANQELLSKTMEPSVAAKWAATLLRPIQLTHNNKHVISARFNEIVRRLGARKAISKSWRDKATLFYPGLNDADDKAEYDKEYKEHSKEYRNASSSVNPDMDVLVRVCERIQSDHPWIDVGHYIEHCFDQIPRDAEPEPKPDKKEKEPRDLPGQQKIDFKVKDDGSTAEPASECVTEKVDDVDKALAEKDKAVEVDTPVEEASTDCAQECLEQAIADGELPADIGAVDAYQMENFVRLANASTLKADQENLLEVVRLAKILGMDGEQLKERFMIGEQFNVTRQQVEKVKQEIQLKLSGFYLELADLATDLDESCQAHIEEIIGFALQMEIPGDELKARFEHPLIPSYGEENLKLVAEKIEADYLAFADKNSPPEKKPEAKQDKRPVAERKKAASKKKK